MFFSFGKKLLAGFLFTVIVYSSEAQIKVNAVTDKPEILIGEPFSFTISASFSAGDFKINWPGIPDSIDHFELLEKGKIDSVFTNQQLTGISQSFRMTSFDSGSWSIPSLPINFDPVKDDTTYNFLTDSVLMNVRYDLSDTTTVLKDIKPIRDVEEPGMLLYWTAVAASALLLLAAIILLTWYLRKKKRNRAVKTGISAYREAINALNELRKAELNSIASVRSFHSKIPFILERYLAARKGMHYRNKTTDGLLVQLTTEKGDAGLVSTLSAVLRCCDAVKFARFIPGKEDSYQCLEQVITSISQIENDINKQESSS